MIEVCRIVDTLLIDHETVYDSRRSNDRLLLGLKGSLMSAGTQNQPAMGGLARTRLACHALPVFRPKCPQQKGEGHSGRKTVWSVVGWV
jgi:hypothetical protein